MMSIARSKLLRLMLIGGLSIGSSLARAADGVEVAEAPVPLKFKQDTAKVDVFQRPGNVIPSDLQFTDSEGKPATIGSYLNRGRPVVLQLGYFRCPQICDVVSQSVMKTVRKMDLQVGKDYDVLFVSIDPKEQWTLAKAKKENYVTEYGKDSAATGWNFFVGDQPNITKLADAIGFKYQYVESQNQYAHPTMITVLTPRGEVSRYLFGVDYSEKTLRMALVEAGDGKVGGVVDQLVMLCYHYDEYSGKYTPRWMFIMRCGGVATIVIMGIVLTWLFRRDARGYRRHAPGLNPVPNQ